MSQSTDSLIVFCQPDIKCHPKKIRGGSSGIHGCFESLFDEVGLWKEELGMSLVKLNGGDHERDSHVSSTM